MIFSEMINCVTEGEVRNYYEKHFDDPFPEAFFNDLISLEPEFSDDGIEIHVKKYFDEFSNEWDVSTYGKAPGDPDSYDLGLDKNVIWLGREVRYNESEMPASAVVACILWDMSFYGYTDNARAEVRDTLDGLMIEYNLGDDVNAD